MRILTEPVPIRRIFLDLSNPRHVQFSTEAQAIEYLCEKEDVLPLARDITRMGLNPLERVALIPIRGQTNSYTMAEGNRRLCALKLLSDPDRAPARMRNTFENLAKQRPPPQEFAAVVFESDEEVRPWLERMHNGAFGGRGRRDWNADQLQRFSGSSKNKIAQAFLDYAVSEGFLSAENRQGKLTTVQRFLVNDVFCEAMGLDKKNPDELARTRPKPEFDTIARRFIRDLVEGTAVNSRMNKPQIIDYARPIGSLPGVTGTRIEPEPLIRAQEATGGDTQPRTRTRRTPRQPQKIRHIQYADEIGSALRSLGNHKLESLYHSICTVELESHTPIVCIGVWAFIETLTACAGRHSGTSFNDFLSNNRLASYGVSGNKTAIRVALTRTQDYGNTTKHEPLAATFNGDQLNNDLGVLKPLILKCIDEAAIHG